MMMIALPLLLALADPAPATAPTTPTSPVEKTRVLVLDLQGDGVSPTTLVLLAERSPASCPASPTCRC